MGLTIQTTDIQLGVEHIPSQLNIRTQNARLEMHREQAELKIHTEQPKVHIDQYECFAEEGLKNNYDFAKEAAQKGYRQVLKYTGQAVQDGYAMAAVENGGNAISSIARRNMLQTDEYGMDFIPKSRPKVEVSGGMNIRWDTNAEGALNGIDGDYIQGNVDIHYEPAKINTYVKQYPSIKISYNNFDESI
jgi:hypothetical protein